MVRCYSPSSHNRASPPRPHRTRSVYVLFPHFPHLEISSFPLLCPICHGACWLCQKGGHLYGGVQGSDEAVRGGLEGPRRAWVTQRRKPLVLSRRVGDGFVEEVTFKPRTNSQVTSRPTLEWPQVPAVALGSALRFHSLFSDGS